MASDTIVHSSLVFLKEDPLYEVEKAYDIRKKYASNVPRTNMRVNLVKDIPIHDVRDKGCSLTTNGFFLLKLDSETKAEDFQEQSMLQKSFLPQLAQAIKQSLKACRVQIFDYTLRKRHPHFPISKGGVYENKQPSCLAHIDATPNDLDRLWRKLNPNEMSSLSKLRCQFLTAWKPLKGPLRDWPLTLCDVRTIDPDSDLQPCDEIDPNEIAETYSVHYRPRQRWCYLRDQMPDEVWVFLQADSNGNIGVPHGSFPHPDTTEDDSLRESIEVRMLVFYE